MSLCRENKPYAQKANPNSPSVYRLEELESTKRPIQTTFHCFQTRLAKQSKLLKRSEMEN